MPIIILSLNSINKDQFKSNGISLLRLIITQGTLIKTTIIIRIERITHERQKIHA
jgi:hypothetical protein